MQPLPPPPSRLLSHRLSPSDFEQYAARSRKPKYDTFGADGPQGHTVHVSGFNDDAETAIRACTKGGEDFLEIKCVPGKDVAALAVRIEDLTLIPAKYWRLTSRDVVLCPTDVLGSAYSGLGDVKDIINLIMVPEEAVMDYLLQREKLREWKWLQRGIIERVDSSDYLVFASRVFNLLVPEASSDWDRYVTQRQDSEWLFARLCERLEDNPLTEMIVKKIQCSLRHNMWCSSLSSDELSKLIDGVLPQVVDAWDESSVHQSLNNVTVYTRVYSAVRPALIDVFLIHPVPGCCRVLYQVHDPAPPAENRLKIYHVRDIKDVPQVGRGWSFLFDIQLDTTLEHRQRRHEKYERTNWGLGPADAQRIHDVLFGSATDGVGSKVSLSDAVLFLLGSVGFSVSLKSAEDPWSEDGPGQSDYLHWRIDSAKWGWIGAKIRAACGTPLPGDKQLMKSVPEGSCFYYRTSYDDVFDDFEIEGVDGGDVVARGAVGAAEL
ncbi:hypothetical protein C8Q74DRAFT_1366720 [Fomes fomentarius]|nr:hypothetical protein C8Q74DRAFT_1366720 [Fomes fomentarius]